MTVREMDDWIEIQGAFCIKEWDWDKDDYIILAKGHDYECDNYDIDDEVMDRKVSYMYAVDGVLNIEVE